MDKLVESYNRIKSVNKINEELAPYQTPVIILDDDMMLSDREFIEKYDNLCEALGIGKQKIKLIMDNKFNPDLLNEPKVKKAMNELNKLSGVKCILSE